jgi:hypothetical protein
VYRCVLRCTAKGMCNNVQRRRWGREEGGIRFGITHRLLLFHSSGSIVIQKNKGGGNVGQGEREGRGVERQEREGRERDERGRERRGSTRPSRHKRPYSGYIGGCDQEGGVIEPICLTARSNSWMRIVLSAACPRGVVFGVQGLIAERWSGSTFSSAL